ncbi:MAG: serine/threonine protein kinase, partial [Acidobacteria bacterium]|nr:serine/threonine protein kinase [Acidobacteriota bacterium]
MSLVEELIGKVLDEKYRIDKQLGQGGMGAVYLATHLGTGRPVALKVIAPQFMAHPESVERFKREAKAAGLLRHPNIVDVTDFGFADVDPARVAYLVMEYLDGISLGEVLKEEKNLPLNWAIDILEQVCLAIDKAHQQGIIHRDLKPDNIWLEPNDRGGFTVKILDFGLARLDKADLSSSDELRSTLLQSTLIEGVNEQAAISFRTADTSERRKVNTNSIHPATQLEALTQAGAVLGTPFYMSPEQCLGNSLDTRSDIYSLGLIAYEMLAGERPFSGNSTQELITQHTQAPPPPLEEKRPDIPKQVRLLVHSALAKDPADRPASAAAFASALRARAEGVSVIIRQAFTLYSEHFTPFFLISLIAYIPGIFLIFLELLDIGLKKSSSSFASIISTFGFALSVLSSMFAMVISAGVFVPVIAQLLIAPLRPVEILPAFAALKKRMRAFVTSTLLFYGVVALFFLCAIFVFAIIYTPISIWIEKGPPRRPLFWVIFLA